MKVLFLDVDGVANQHVPHPNGYCGMTPECVARLNRVFAATDCKVVVSSSWRYMVLGGEMTVKGLEYLFLTHGLNVRDRLLGVTPSDEATGGHERRAEQVASWIREWRDDVQDRAAVRPPVPVYAVVDDRPYDFPPAPYPFVHVAESSGLTDADADRLIELLGALV